MLTIALLAFVVLAVVSLTVVSRISAQTAAQAVHATQARQNALLALDRAVGQLQKLAGPDQRTTATSDLIANRHESKRFWTGVWDQTGNLRGWLISGSDSSVSGAMPETDLYPMMVGSNSVDSATPVIRAPVEEVANVSENGTTVVVGHLAFWVGDEGVKATVNFDEILDQIDWDGSAFISRASETTDSAVADEAKRLRQMLAARPRIEQLATNLDPSDMATRAKLKKVLAFEQISEVGTLQLKSAFHDLTPMSFGVLANPVDGGLKIDMSATGGAEEAGGDDVATWLRLRPLSQTKTSARHEFRAASAGISVGPVMTEFSVRFAFFRNAPQLNSVAGNLAVHCQMQVELWNPYTSTLVSDGSRGLRFRVTGLPTNLVVTTAAGQAIPVNLQAAFDGMDFSLPPSTTFAPGSVSVFYGGANWSSASLDASGAAAGRIVDLNVNIPSNNADRSLLVSSSTPLATTSIAVSVDYGSETMATYSPGVVFKSVATSIPSWGNSGSSNSTWAFGYGFAAKDSITFWTDGSQPSSADPRIAAISGSFVEPVATLWSEDPVANKDVAIARSGGATSGTTFYGSTAADAPRYMPFELPRQEAISLGALQHLPASRPNTMGNPWGDDVNLIFDRGFFSAFSGNTSSLPDPVLPLTPNGFLTLYRGAGVSSLDGLFNANTAAEHLLIKGVFNVNSTSSRAWRAVLGGNKLPANYVVSDKLEHAFFRHSHSAQDNSSLASKPVGAATAWRQGVRNLPAGGDDGPSEVVTALADTVAALIKNRGRPFTSMAEFLNAGILDSALDPSISLSAYLTGGKEADRVSINGGTTLLRGMPGYLSQADIVTMIAPFIAARSDTFKIRAYGDAVDPIDGTIQAKAYCEAIVQRTPELIDATLGRRFVITYFRWLGPDDI